MRKNKLYIILFNFYIILSLIIIFTAIYIRKDFGDISFEQLLYSIRNAEGTSFEAIKDGIIYVVVGTLIGYLFILLIWYLISKLRYRCVMKINVGWKSLKFRLFPVNKKICIMSLLVCAVIFFLDYLKIFDYYKSQSTNSSIFEEYYVDPRDVEIEFDNGKKNLIYIIVESLESTLMSTDNGGVFEESRIPNLEILAQNNINFSATKANGGFYTQTGNSWTAAALISQTAGIPLKVLVDGNSYADYGETLPGVYTIGEVLADNGYSNYFMLGSDATFGGRRDYFTYHGNYEILDYKWAIDTGKIDKDYFVWWGYEDSKLYEYAKEELLEIAKQDGNFNFTMLTADTHFVDGYVDESCTNKFEGHYDNSYYCTDMMLNDFVNWIKEQDFYEDTVVVIVGDHLTMQNGLYDDSVTDRTVYNVFMNTGIENVNNKNRLVSTMDMYPTTLAAIGANIPGNRLGLGTNLFSNRKTLIEEFGILGFDEELNKKSKFYNDNLLQGTYYKMLIDVEEQEAEIEVEVNG